MCRVSRARMCVCVFFCSVSDNPIKTLATLCVCVSCFALKEVGVDMCVMCANVCVGNLFRVFLFIC